MNDPEFQALVKLDAFGKASRDRVAILQHPDNLSRWLDELVAIKCDLQAQLVEKKADFTELTNVCWAKGKAGSGTYFDAKAKYEAWRATTIRLMTGVEKRLAEVRKLRKAEEEASRIDFKAELRDAVSWAYDLLRSGEDPTEWFKRYDWLVENRIIQEDTRAERNDD